MSLRHPEMAVPPDEGHSAASGTETTYSRVAELPVRIERCELLPLVRDTSSGFTKISTVVRLTGNGHEGQGEDITWDQIDQIEQLRRPGDLAWLRGSRTAGGILHAVGAGRPFPGRADPRQRPLLPPLGVRERGARPRPTPERPLAAGRPRASGEARDFRGVDPARGPRQHRPPASAAQGRPGLRFKLDPIASWDDELLAELASFDAST